jgi:N-acetylglutamate synthase-like GNAT family acetyltransferase
MELRTALADDIPAIERLIEASVRTLQAGDYTAVQREAALHKVFGVDRQLIADQTYFLIEEGQALIGCGGWSYRRTLFGADAIHGRDSTPLDPASDAAKIRAFFVHPDAARRGVATRLLEACEAAATAAGFTRLELGATLTGVAFYARQGFVAGERLEAPLGDGERLAIVRMSKTLG